ncbi:MAG: hypothetical protein GC192_16085 [Bacteroidetes bacterium]|nr:hypothetical protein [Bacteroidota bacterium]
METKLTFNSHGLLTPQEAIPADLEMVKLNFVDAFPKSKTRARLYENLIQFNETLQKEVFPWYEMWVNGSFVTKKQNPKDVDVVVFLDAEVYKLREKKLDKILAYCFEKLRIDAYFVLVFPENHKFFTSTQLNRNDWFIFFTTLKSGSRKGFLQLIFENKI